MQNEQPDKEKGEKLDLILVPTDYSPFSCKAFPWAALFAIKFNSKILILHVIPASTAEWMTQIPGNNWDNILEKEDKWMLEHITASVKADVHLAIEVETLVKVGQASIKIIETAKEHNVSMIVMSTHGRTGLPHIVMGSVARKVIRDAPCPVFIVNPKIYIKANIRALLEKEITSVN